MAAVMKTSGLAGLLTGAVALGVAELTAAVTGPNGAPVTAVGETAINLTPVPVKEFAIAHFGTHDKAALVTGIVMLLAAFAVLIGVLAVRRLAYGLAALAVFAAVGVAAAVSQGGGLNVVPTLAGAAVAGVTLVLMVHAIRGTASAGGPGGRGLERRRLLIVGAGAAALGVAAGGLGNALLGRFSVASSRAAVRLPGAAVPAPAVPAGTDLRIPGLTPFMTSNASFYRVDTDLVLPQVPPETWTLRIEGMVGRPVELTFAELLKMPLTEADITLVCVSNQVGGTYNGNATWLGVPLAGLLRRARVRAGADQVLSAATDGMTISTPVAAIMDGRNALLAVGMNGQPLPVAHGFPARMIVPGLYGYVSATKWVTKLTLTTFARQKAYWTQRGYSAQAPIKNRVAHRRAQAAVPGQGRPRHGGGRGLGAGQGHRQGRGQRGQRPVAAGHAGRLRRHRHLAAVDVGLGRQARAAQPPGPGHRQLRRDADTAARLPGTQRRQRLGLRRGDRHLTGAASTG